MIWSIQNSVFNWPKWLFFNFQILINVSFRSHLLNSHLPLYSYKQSFNIMILVTISCDIGLSPKQTANQYKLSALYGQCDVPSRSSSRKRRSEPDGEDLSKINISKTIKVSSKKSNKKSNALRNHSFAVSLIVIAMFLLWLLFPN